MIIRIHQLRAKTLIGVNPEERAAPRELVLDIDIEYDHTAAVTSDNVADVPDYARIEQQVIDMLAAQQFHLLESLAAHVAKNLLGLPHVRRVTLSIDKPGVLRYARMVSVIHTASND